MATFQGTWSRYSVLPQPTLLLQGPASASGLGFGWMYILGPQRHGVYCPPPECRVPDPVVGRLMAQGMYQMQGMVPSKETSLPKSLTM